MTPNTRMPVLYNPLMRAPDEIIFEVLDSPEGGYKARAIGYSIFTEGDTEDELRTMVRDAVRCHFEDGESPAVIRLHFVRDVVMSA